MFRLQTSVDAQKWMCNGHSDTGVLNAGTYYEFLGADIYVRKGGTDSL